MEGRLVIGNVCVPTLVPLVLVLVLVLVLLVPGEGHEFVLDVETSASRTRYNTLGTLAMDN
jgi:hypothetical protein